ncbi:cobalt ABC transporter permease [Marivivens aquimaris]|uniref:cobalt ABC transporter permease n=1 Tax=Marivivens aquimaris TaxID=2774876 RepID=UPI0018824670|nr:cobalt ABC transporter permease [Marivivens aquimaris]
MRAYLLAAAIALAPLPALAHKVIFGVFPSGDMIEGELGFSNGDMAVDQLVEVFDQNGEKLGEATTDADGFFVYQPSEAITHVFRADLGAGHVGEVEMPAAEVGEILGIAAEEEALREAAPVVSDGAGGVTVAALTLEEKLAIAEIVRDEIRPLRREITAYKEHNNLQTILGGLGYIVGLFGVGFYFAARRKLAA